MLLNMQLAWFEKQELEMKIDRKSLKIIFYGEQVLERLRI